jgi:hypothetical protein
VASGYGCTVLDLARSSILSTRTAVPGTTVRGTLEIY